MTTSHISDFFRDGIRVPLEYAIVAGMSGEEIVQSFDVTFQAPYPLRRRLLTRLSQLCQESPAQREYARKLITKIETGAVDLPRRKQRSADATVAELATLLPTHEAEVVASSFVLDQGMTRRLSGYKLIKALSDSDLMEVLFRSYSIYGDAQALVTLLAKGADISRLHDIEGAVAGLRERYHQALAIERLLLHDRPSAMRLANDFPMAFIWASGRLRDETARPFVVRHFKNTLREVEALKEVELEHEELYRFLALNRELNYLIWALGRVGATEQLEDLAAKYNIDLP